MTAGPLSLRPLIHRESDRLADRLDRISEVDWQRPTPCAEWRVADIVAHLASGAGVQVLSFQRGLRDETSPPLKDQAERDALTRAKLDLPAGAKAADYRREMDRLLDMIDSFTEVDLDKKAWHRTGPQPIAWFMSQRLGEVTLHSGDIHTGLDSSFRFPADVAEALAPAYLARLPRLVRPDAPPELHAVVGFGAFGTLSLQEGAASYDQAGSAATPTIAVGAEPATLLLMATGRIDPKDALTKGELQATGDIAVLERWPEVFRPL